MKDQPNRAANEMTTVEDYLADRASELARKNLASLLVSLDIPVSVENLRNVVISTRRKNAKHPADFTVAVVDDVVKALRGKPENSTVDIYLVIAQRKLQ